MKIFFKIFKIAGISLIALSAILFSASVILQDKVAHIILKSLNSSLSTKLDVGSFHLSFLKKFPKASLELKDVYVHSSTGFNSEQFKGINTDTLLAAKFVSIEFSISDIINENYKIERISAKSGKASFFYDLSGFVNYDISIKSENPEKKVFTIDLERINLSDIETYYNNLATKLIIKGFISKGRLKSRITGDYIDFTALAETEINSFQLYGTTISKKVKALIDLTLRSSKEGIRFKEGTIAVDNYDFGLTGFVGSDNYLDLTVTGHNVDIDRIKNYLPDKYLKLASDYSPSGLLILNCKIKGPLTRTKNPHVEISCILKNGSISYGKSDISIRNLSFSGNVSNGPKNNMESSIVALKDLHLNLGSSEYDGSLTIANFNHPRSDISLAGRVFPAELKEYFNIEDISTASGSADMDFKIVTDYWPKDSVTINDIIDMKPGGKINFNSLSLGFRNDRYIVNNVNGVINISNYISAENLGFNFKGQEIKIDGEFRNLPEWLSGRPVQMKASGKLEFDRLFPDLFIEKTSGSDISTSSKTGISFPGDLNLDFNIKIDSLYYKTYSASDITSNLTYKPRLLTFTSLNMKSLKGIIAGNGFVVQNSTKAIIARGIFNLTEIDVNRAFTTFHNFGQDFIKAENLKGDLSGNLSVLLPLDSMLNPQIKSITAEGKYILVNGALVNFEPIKELSSFIELSELENIHFEKLENDFFIKNNFLYIPQMDVKSSAADLSVNGKHSFDNDYEYHVKMLLSEILSKKRKKNKSNITEFGVIEDDGLGRTSILLKIVNKGEDVKVSYDLKAAGAGVKNNIKSERQTLKTILNQEYGWYKSDTTARPKPAEKKTKFRISWDDTDTVKKNNDQTSVKRENPIKNILKKK